MSNFMDYLKEGVLNNYNESTTENGAKGYRTTGKELLDLNFAVSSLRNAADDEIKSRFLSAFMEDPALAITWLFYARDARQGLGERRLFRVCSRFLFTSMKFSVEQMLKYTSFIAEYGRYDDLYSLVGISKEIDTIITTTISNQLEEDIINMANKKSVSLLAKWLASEKASSATTKSYAKWTREHLGMSAKTYRQTLSSLRKYIDITEVKMCNNEWDKISYSAVPSKASLNYKGAFYKHDKERYSEFISKVNAGEEKINASVTYPYEIVNKYSNDICWYNSTINNIDETLEALWKNLPDTVKGNGNTLVVADGSGSMTSRIGNSSVSALDVANSLAIYFAEHASGIYKGKYITFSQNPRFVDFTNCTTLRDKLNIAFKHCEVANTDIYKVFKLILTTAIDNNCKQENMPTNILILSDMEFDQGATSTDEKLFVSIKKEYEAAGYKLPRLVFWNINSRTNTIPVRENELGVALVSGFSANIAKMVMDQELDPYKCLVNVLTSDRYKDVLETFKK